MQRRLLLILILPLLLIACDPGTLTVPALALSTPSPLATVAPIPPSPTSTPIPPPTVTDTPTETPANIPTDTAVPTNTSTEIPAPSNTPNLYPHVFPIQPPGQATFSEGGHGFPATDIFAPPGARFVAVTNGIVEDVSRVDLWDPANPDPSKAGGLSVHILGDDGVRYYGAHLSSIAKDILPGVWVPAGQSLGLVGNSGDARGTTAHVHFEISDPFSPSTLVDPFFYLTAWRKGQNLTPVLAKP
jgi:peptidoglycan LD-endopeptidase LytH